VSLGLHGVSPLVRVQREVEKWGSWWGVVGT
jgi:hypothetical protein